MLQEKIQEDNKKCSYKAREGRKEPSGNEYKMIKNMTALNSNISIITLNMNGIKRLHKNKDYQSGLKYKDKTQF